MVIARQGDDAATLMILREGAVKAVLQSTSGTEHIGAFYFPGDILNLCGLEDDRHHASVIPLSTATVCHIPKNLLQLHMRHNTALASALLQASIQALRHATWLAALLSQGSAEERIMVFLQALAEKMPGAGRPPHQLQLAMSRRDMANHLSLAVATVSRTLGQLERHGLVRCSGRTILFPGGPSWKKGPASTWQ
jgi:CRP/FNR family transcriptional regulator